MTSHVGVLPCFLYILHAWRRLYGSYELLHHSCIADILTLLTGGLVEQFNFTEELPDEMFDILLQALDSGSVITCSIDVCIIIVPLNF